MTERLVLMPPVKVGIMNRLQKLYFTKSNFLRDQHEQRAETVGPSTEKLF